MAGNIKYICRNPYERAWELLAEQPYVQNWQNKSRIGLRTLVDLAITTQRPTRPRLGTDPIPLSAAGNSFIANRDGILQLIEYLRSSRCLLVLDNAKTILLVNA